MTFGLVYVSEHASPSTTWPDWRKTLTLSRQLVEYLQQFDLPLIACIRQSQRYVQAVETGVTLFDGNRIDSVDQLHWRPLLDWLVRRR